jgi:hypothetical protein
VATPTPEIAEVIVRGTGRTPDLAIQDALRTAVYRAVAAQVDGKTWARRGKVLAEEVWRNRGGLIRGWKELGASRGWGLKGAVHHKDLAVEVNRRALAERLQAVNRSAGENPRRGGGAAGKWFFSFLPSRRP